jgi:hypothetical protein
MGIVIEGRHTSPTPCHGQGTAEYARRREKSAERLRAFIEEDNKRRAAAELAERVAAVLEALDRIGAWKRGWVSKTEAALRAEMATLAESLTASEIQEHVVDTIDAAYRRAKGSPPPVIGRR